MKRKITRLALGRNGAALARGPNTFADIFSLSSFGGNSEERQIAETAARVHQKFSARNPQPVRHEWIGTKPAIDKSFLRRVN